MKKINTKFYIFEEKYPSVTGDPGYKNPFGTGGTGYKNPFETGGTGGTGYKNPFETGGTGGTGYKNPFETGGTGYKNPFETGGTGYKNPFETGGTNTKQPQEQKVNKNPKLTKAQIREKFPDCVRYNPKVTDNDFYITENDDHYLAVLNGGYLNIWIKIADETTKVFRDLSQESAYQEGNWYCDGEKINLFYKNKPPQKRTVDQDRKVVVWDGLRDQLKKTLRFNPFKLLAKVNGEQQVNLDIKLVEEAVDQLIQYIDLGYQGLFYQEFVDGVELLVEYSKSGNDKADVVDLNAILTRLENKISGGTNQELISLLSGDDKKLYRVDRNPRSDKGYDVLKVDTYPWSNLGEETPKLYRSKLITQRVTDINKSKTDLSDREAKFTYTTENCMGYLESIVKNNNLCDIMPKPESRKSRRAKQNFCSGIKGTGGTVIMPGTEDYDLNQLKGIVTSCYTGGAYTPENLKPYYKSKNKDDEWINETVDFIPTIANFARSNFYLQKENNNLKKINMKKELILKNHIRKALVEKTNQKKNYLMESKIVRNRFKFLIESRDLNNIKFNEKKQNLLFYDIITEMVLLDKKGYDRKVIAEAFESLMGILQNLFGLGGPAVDAISGTLKEKGISFILNKLGISEGSYLRDLLVVSLGNVDLVDIPKLFNNCDFLTSKIAESIPEAYLKQLQRDKGLGGDFGDGIRNALYDVIKNSDFAEKVKAAISGPVCALVSKMGTMFQDRFDQMKSSLVQN